MANTSFNGRHWQYMLIGFAIPVTFYLVLTKVAKINISGKSRHVDQLHDITVEDSFPASDPPSAW